MAAAESSATDRHPSASPEISVRELLGLVKEDAEKYIPKPSSPDNRYSLDDGNLYWPDDMSIEEYDALNARWTAEAEARERQNEARRAERAKPTIGQMRTDFKGTPEERFSIETLPNGDEYVRADRPVIFGNDPESWGQQVEDYINGRIRRGQDMQLLTEDGDVLLLTATSAGKLSSIYDGKGKTPPEKTYETKLNAASHIDELAQISRKGRSRADEGGIHSEFANKGFNYRNAYFRTSTGSIIGSTYRLHKARTGM